MWFILVQLNYHYTVMKMYYALIMKVLMIHVNQGDENCQSFSSLYVQVYYSVNINFHTGLLAELTLLVLSRPWIWNGDSPLWVISLLIS